MATQWNRTIEQEQERQLLRVLFKAFALVAGVFVVGMIVAYTFTQMFPNEYAGEVKKPAEEVKQEVRRPNVDPFADDPRKGIRITGMKAYDKDYSVAVKGRAVNLSDKAYSYVSITYSIENKAGEKVGIATAVTSSLKPMQSWRFEAIGAAREGMHTVVLEEVTAF
jgi:hypothetical protein